MKVIIIGAGGFAQEISAILEGFKGFSDHEFLGYLDDDLTKAHVIGAIKNHKIIPEAVYICGIGNPEIKLKICQNFSAQGAKLPVLIHTSAVLARTASIGEGSIIFPGCYIANNAKLSNFVSVNFNTGIGHDTIIGEGSTICALCDITGNVKLGKGVYMGSNSTIHPGKKMGDYVKIGLGSAVTRSVAAAVTVMGVPAKRISFSEDK